MFLFLLLSDALLALHVARAQEPKAKQSRVNAEHAKKMARIKPKLDAIKKKYKDPRKQQQAQMKLMREEKMSLVPGGCLLAFVQMPIWFALYGLLGTTASTSWIWATRTGRSSRSGQMDGES